MHATYETLPETNSSHLKMDGWNTTFLLGRPIFRDHVSFREGMIYIYIFLKCFINMNILVLNRFIYANICREFLPAAQGGSEALAKSTGPPFQGRRPGTELVAGRIGYGHF